MFSKIKVIRIVDEKQSYIERNLRLYFELNDFLDGLQYILSIYDELNDFRIKLKRHIDELVADLRYVNTIKEQLSRNDILSEILDNEDKAVDLNGILIFTRKSGDYLQILFEIGEDELYQLKKFGYIEFDKYFVNPTIQILLSKIKN